MRDSVRQAFANFTSDFESTVPFMYLDVKSLVTTGRGNLIDPIEGALGLPFELNSVPVSRAEIAAEWRLVKSRTDLARAGGWAFAAITRLRLAPAAIDDLTVWKLGQMEGHLIARFPQFPSWPADAQLGLLSMAWAMGQSFQFPMFQACVAAFDFEGAASQCNINATGNHGVVRRNVANELLFLNASFVVKFDLDRERLYYPLRARPLDVA